jgi:hypothetical protein
MRWLRHNDAYAGLERPDASTIGDPRADQRPARAQLGESADQPVRVLSADLSEADGCADGRLDESVGHRLREEVDGLPA